MVRDRYVFLVIVSVPFILFAPDILSGGVLLPLDLLQNVGPFSASVAPELQRVKNPHLTDLVLNFFPWIEMFRAGEEFIALWNPYSFCGSPLLANSQTTQLFPLTWIYRLLPLGAATFSVALIKLIFAGIFSYRLFGILHSNKWACLFGSLTYMLSGHLIVWLGYPTSFPLSCLPFLFWALEKHIHARRVSDLAWISLAYGLLFLGGQPQTGFLVTLGSGIYFFIRTHASPGERKKRILGLFVAGLLGFCIAAPQLLPFLEYLHESAAFRLRGTYGWKQYPWFTLVSWILPRIFGDPREGNYWGFSSFSGEAVYIGGIPLILATLGIVRAKRDSYYRAVTAVFLVGLLGLYMPLAQWLFGHVPLLGNIDNNKLIVLVTFGLVSLSAAGLNEILEGRSSRSAVFALWNGATLFWALLAGIVLMHFREAVRQLHLAAFLNSEIVIHSALVLAGSGLLWLWKLRSISSNFLGLVLVSLITFDLVRVWKGYYPSFPYELTRLRSTSVEFLRANLGEKRFLGLAGFLPPEASVLFRLQDVRGYDAMTPYRYYEILGKFAPTTQDLIRELEENAPRSTEWSSRTLFYRSLEPFLRTPRLHRALRRLNYWSSDIRQIERVDLLSLLCVRYVLSPLGTPMPAGLGLRRVHSSDADVWENLDVLPKAFISTVPVFVDSDRAALEAISKATFDFRKAAVISIGEEKGDAGKFSFSARQAELIPVKFLRYSPHVVELIAESDSGGWLVLCDLFYPGWRASVDGVAAQIIPANYLFRGVKIPAGRHRVSFSYRPPSFYVGVALAFLALIVVVWMLAARPLAATKPNTAKL